MCYNNPSISSAKSEPVSLDDVLEAELSQIVQVREKRKAHGMKFNLGIVRKPAETRVPEATSQTRPAWQTRKTKWVSVIANAHEANLTGLAFSGGGIRSATFNLGVLQALADLNLLPRIDYLSTVSGGGYIGGWLAAWTKRAKSFAEVQKRLAMKRVDQEEDNEPDEIRFLRMFSNYLTPKVGLFSADTWAAGAIILRNILLNLVVLLASLILVLLLPRVVVELGSLFLAATTGHEILVGLVFVSVLLVALLIVMINMAYLDAKIRSRWTKQGPILCLVVIPLFAITILLALWHPQQSEQFFVGTLCGAGAGAYAVSWLMAILIGVFSVRLRRRSKPPKSENEVPPASPQETWEITWTLNDTVTLLIWAIPSGALAGWLYAIYRMLSENMDVWCIQEKLTFGVPIVLSILLLTGTLHIGLMGIGFRDRRREWWGRLGGWLLLGGIVWLTIFWLALYFPQFISHLAPSVLSLAKKYLTPAWILTTIGGVLAGKGDTSGKPGELNWKDYLARAAPYIFITGLMCWLSWGIDLIVADSQWLYAALGGCAVVATVMSWRVDINQFSMHQLYRNRLVRCYLGASNKGRSPNRFTGLDKTDELALTDLRKETGYDGPYPILNAALNLVKGQDLAWQERKAESFVMTPLYCGYDVWLEEQDSPLLRGERHPEPGMEPTQRRKKLHQYGYRKTEEYAFPPPSGRGLFLGTAMGISGAAASPNMGSYTSAPVAFLMTVFNVRLGQWLGNPRHIRTWRRPTPRWGLTYLINELFGGTTDEAAYVYLSDGGHFDNMAVYELVKRRCGLIIVCDAEADNKYEYSGLGNAIRKCRIDMGIDIDLDLTDITPEANGKLSKKHYAVGAIHYEHADLNAPTGTIIYIKASLTGDEPSDVQNYKKTRCAFPHESTIDQWFSESQFESYRKLGYHELISSMRQTGPTRWWSTAAAAISARLSCLVSTTAPSHKDDFSKHPRKNEELRRILADFGFDVPSSHSVPGTVSS